MKRTVIDLLIIVAAAAGVVLLLKKGGEAGISKVKQATPPATGQLVDATPIHPLVIEGQIDNFVKPIALQPMKSWDAELKYGFVLSLSENPKLNQPRARVALVYPTAASIVLNIEYTAPQHLFDIIEADSAAKPGFDKVAVQVTTRGGNLKRVCLANTRPSTTC